MEGFEKGLTSYLNLKKKKEGLFWWFVEHSLQGGQGAAVRSPGRPWMATVVWAKTAASGEAGVKARFKIHFRGRAKKIC